MPNKEPKKEKQERGERDVVISVLSENFVI